MVCIEENGVGREVRELDPITVQIEDEGVGRDGRDEVLGTVTHCGRGEDSSPCFRGQQAELRKGVAASGGVVGRAVSIGDGVVGNCLVPGIGIHITEKGDRYGYPITDELVGLYLEGNLLLIYGGLKGRVEVGRIGEGEEVGGG